MLQRTIVCKELKLLGKLTLTNFTPSPPLLSSLSRKQLYYNPQNLASLNGSQRT